MPIVVCQESLLLSYITLKVVLRYARRSKMFTDLPICSLFGKQIERYVLSAVVPGKPNNRS